MSDNIDKDEPERDKLLPVLIGSILGCIIIVLIGVLIGMSMFQ